MHAYPSHFNVVTIICILPIYAINLSVELICIFIRFNFKDLNCFKYILPD